MFCCCTAGGFLIARGYATKSKNMKLVLSMLNDIKRMIRFSRPEISEILDRLEENDSFRALSIIHKDSNYGFFDFSSLRLGQTTEKTLDNYFEKFGTRDYESEMETLNETIDTMMDYTSAAENDRVQKGRLYSCMGLLIGTFAVVILV